MDRGSEKPHLTHRERFAAFDPLSKKSLIWNKLIVFAFEYRLNLSFVVTIYIPQCARLTWLCTNCKSISTMFKLKASTILSTKPQSLGSRAPNLQWENNISMYNVSKIHILNSLWWWCDEEKTLKICLLEEEVWESWEREMKKKASAKKMCFMQKEKW